MVVRHLLVTEKLKNKKNKNSFMQVLAEQENAKFATQYLYVGWFWKNYVHYVTKLYTKTIDCLYFLTRYITSMFYFTLIECIRIEIYIL